MDSDLTPPTDKDQITSSTGIEPEHDKDSAASNQPFPEDVSTTECVCNTKLPSDTPEAEAHAEPGLWTAQDDAAIDRELTPHETDIRQFMEDFKDFHELMIQLNESRYYGRQMDTIHASIQTDLLDLLGELTYRREEEAEERRQKAELEELLKCITDDDDSEDEDNLGNSRKNDDVGQDSKVGQDDHVDENDEVHDVVKELMDDLLNIVIASCDNNNDKSNNQ